MRGSSHLVCSIFALCLLAAGHSASEDMVPILPDVFEVGERYAVAEVIDGESLMLNDGRVVHLTGIQAPGKALDAESDAAKTWPLSLEATGALTALIGAEPVILAYGGNRLDRHGRVLAQVANSKGQWLQGTLLSRGLARVNSYPDNRKGIIEMLALEQRARADRRGLWRDPLYAVRRAEDASEDVGTFQLVEGRVLKVAVVGGRAYLNFGEDWRSDFTLVIEPARRRKFENEGLDPQYYEGRRVRVRGWLGYRNGATITVTHPEQIEVLDR